MKTALSLLRRAALVLAASCLGASAHAGKVLEAVRARGQVVCGVPYELAGFALLGGQRRMAGFDADICRAIAAAVLGDGDKVRFVQLSAAQRFAPLQSGEIDVLSRVTTFTLARDTAMGLATTAVTYYDGQGFMVPVKSQIRNARQLRGKPVCVQAGTTSEDNLVAFSRANNLGIQAMAFETLPQTVAAYLDGRCAAYTTDASGLASIRLRETRNPDEHAILPELISKEPLGPMVRRGDEEWQAIVKWVVHGLVEAEELGITQANLELQKTSQNPSVQRLLGVHEDTGKFLGLGRDWMAQAIRATGNYGEIFERNLGPKSTLRLPRGINNLWTRGGLQYALPIK